MFYKCFVFAGNSPYTRYKKNNIYTQGDLSIQVGPQRGMRAEDDVAA